MPIKERSRIRIFRTLLLWAIKYFVTIGHCMETASIWMKHNCHIIFKFYIVQWIRTKILFVPKSWETGVVCVIEYWACALTMHFLLCPVCCQRHFHPRLKRWVVGLQVSMCLFIKEIFHQARNYGCKDPIPSDKVPRPPLGYSTHSVSSLSFRPLLAQKDPLAHHQPRTFWRTQKTTGQRLRRRLFLVGLPKAAQQCSVVVELFGSTRSRDRLFIDGFCWWSTRGSSIGD